MGRLPVVTGRQVVRALTRGGFSVVRIKGSHHFLRHDTDPSRQTVVPVHGSEDLGRALLGKILRDVGLTIEEFAELL
ncbi:MAG: type II toxin-antitoxin system HicA family toxin [Proteobacteria bacterium]|nr:type II toxin-antitoxin system HicA family toxin [Pseudomonadota bacterium]